MEEKPPQRAGREAPRSRTPRAAFSTPEQPTPPSKPAERAPRRAAKSAPPTVTFQPPDEGSEPVPQKKPAPRKAPVRRTAPEAEVRPAADSDQARTPTPRVEKAAGAAGRSEPIKAAKAAQPAKTAAAAEPAKAVEAAEPAKAEPTKPAEAAEAIKAEPAKAEPANAAKTAEPAKAEPAKAAEAAKAAEPVKAAAEPVKAAAEPAKAAKAAPVKKAARKATRTGAKAIPRATTPAQRKPATTGEETAQVGTELATTEARAVELKPAAKAAVARPDTEPRTEAWAKIVADPGHAPELLALAAVQTIGPRAEEWARRTREEYPSATPDALARLAVAQFTRVGSVGSVFAALAGSYAPIALLGVNAYTYAELILHVAAAHGLDPTDPRRAVDLLVLSQVHPDAEAAEAALAIARQPAYEEEARFTDAVWRLGRMAATQAAVWMLLKGVNRFFPGAAVLAAVMTSRSGARNMGVRATRFYSQDDQRPA
jgi:hypothetical protein